MKLTTEQLRQIIKEELEKAMEILMVFNDKGVFAFNPLRREKIKGTYVSKAQQPYYGQIVKASQGDKKAEIALINQLKAANVEPGRISYITNEQTRDLTEEEIEEMILQELNKFDLNLS
tara:strand:- start:35 stop:391 length:357 start_codon:yes stop_codon:yes gene_type:complete